MIDVFIKYKIFDACIDVLFRRIIEGLIPVPIEYELEDWSLKCGGRYKKILVRRGDAYVSYYDCMVLDMIYSTDGLGYLITYRNGGCRTSTMITYDIVIDIEK